MGMLNQIEMKI